MIGLSAGLERLFFPEGDELQSITIQQLLTASKHQSLNLELLLEEAKIPYRVLNLKDIAWPQDSLAQVLNGQTLRFYDANLGEQLYIKLDGDKILEITLPSVTHDQDYFLLYRSLFFILLGGLIALWLWPLWRDLETLKKCVSTLGPDGNITENKVSSRSLVAPIASSLNMMREQIANLIQTQRELSGAVAHEFRSPLARLKFAFGMQESEQIPMLKDMQQDVCELEKLVQEMLDFSASEAQTPELHFAEIPLLSLCQCIVDKYSESHIKGISVSLKGSQTTVTADGHFVERAVENLVLNACRYAQSQIEITVEVNQEYIGLTVEDDGIGVPESLMKKIFDPFFRPDEGRTREQGGAGLGLAIVKRVMQWHQGLCTVSKSQLGGARFTLRFPNTP